MHTNSLAHTWTLRAMLELILDVLEAQHCSRLQATAPPLASHNVALTRKDYIPYENL